MKYRGSFHRFAWFAGAVVALAALSASPAFAVAPAQPTGLTALDAPGDQGFAIRLFWTANTEDDLKEYRIRRSTVTGITLGTPVLATINQPGTTHQDAGLTNGTTYYYAISARNYLFEESGLSVEVSSIPADNLGPVPPTGLAAADVPSDQGTALNLNWTANTEADLASYSILKSTTSPFTSGFVARILAPGTTHQEGALSVGVTYYYHMRARDTAGNDSAISSPDVSAYPVDNIAPGAPIGLGTGNAGTGNRMNVSWFANTETDLKDYRVRRSTGTGITAATSVLVTGSATTYQDVDVVNGTTYYYRVAARDVSFNESGLSLETTGANPSDLGAPGTPINVNVQDVPADQGFQVRVFWGSNPETDLKDYGVYRSTAFGQAATPSTRRAYIVVPGTTHQDGGLSNGTSYYYKVTARDTGPNESAATGDIAVTPSDNLAPAAPTGVAVADVPADQGTALNLNWTANGESDRKDYGIYQSTGAGQPAIPANRLVFVPDPGTTHQATGLSAGTTYYYKLTARDVSLNESGASGEVSAYPQDNVSPAAPTVAAASSPGTGNRLNLSWFSNTEADLKDYRVYRSTNLGVTQVSSHVVAAIAAVPGPGTTHQDAGGITNGTTYYYRLSARDNSLNESGLSTEFSAVPTDTGPPATPVNVNVQDVPGDEGFQARVFWGANVEADLKDYGVYRSTAFGQAPTPSTRRAYIAAVPGPGTTHQDGGLSNGTSYYYKVTARDTGLNESAPTGDIAVTPSDNLAPLAPTGLAVTDAPGDQGGSLRLNWTANTEADRKDYRVYGDTGPGVTAAPTLLRATILSPGTTHQEGSNLSPGTTYYFRIAARDISLNESGLSTEVSGSPVDNLVPAAPSGSPVLSDVPNDQGTRLNLSWLANTEADLKDYGVYRATVTGVLGTKTLATRILGPATTHRDLGLNPGVTYYYQLTARDNSTNESGGSAESSTYPQDNMTPTAPGGVTAVNAGTGGHVNMIWSSNTESDIKDYRIRRSTGTGITLATPVLAQVVAPGTTHQDAGLTNNTTYYYRVTARDTMNESGVSVESSTRTTDTTAPAPVDLTAATPAAEVRLTFNAVGDNGMVGGPNASYQVRYATGNATPIDTEGEWNAAYIYAQSWVPSGAGVPETRFLNGLTPGVTYYFAVKAVDGSGNIGTVGNSLQVVASPWESTSLSGIGLSSGTIAWGDYDGDGDMDLAVNGFDGSFYRFKIYRNDTGTFNLVQEPAGALAAPADGAVAWGDFDGDGDLDIAVSGTDGSNYRFQIYRNDGGTFNLWQQPAGSGGPGGTGGGLAVGDLDGDGDLDIAENCEVPPAAAAIRIWRNDSGPFVWVSTYAFAPSRDGSIALADYDNDGDLDIAAQGDTSAGIALRIYRNDGGMTFANVQTVSGLRDGGLAWGDYDNDGDMDLAANGNDGGGQRFRVFRNDSGTFNQVSEPAGATGPGQGAVAWGDVDHDGDLDLIVSGYTGSAYKFQVYRNDSGTFNLYAEPGGVAGLGGGSVAVADYDDDGDLDLVVTGSDGSGRRIEVYKSFIVDRPGGGMTTNAKPTNPNPTSFVLTYSSTALRGDLSWPGATDESFSGNSLSYVTAMATSSIVGGGGATFKVQHFADAPSLLGPLRRKLTDGTTGLRVYGLTTDTTFYWVVLTVDAGLRKALNPVTELVAGTYVLPNVITDLAADTAAQMLLRWTAPGDDGTIGTIPTYILRYRTDASINGGNWATSFNYSTAAWGAMKDPNQIERRMLVGLTPNATYYFAIVPVDRKNNMPAISNMAQAMAGEFSQNFFTGGAGVVPGGDTHDSAALGDLDGDGDLDLIAGKYIYRNDGGTVVTGPTMGAVVSSPCVRIFDFNLDGKNDVAQSGWDGSSARKARIFRNDGNDGALMPIMVQFQDLLGGNGLQWGGIAVADFDNDGAPDLAMTGTIDGADAGARFYIFRNNRSSLAPFTSTQEPAGANQGFYRGEIEAADLDQDGDMDLIVSGRDNTGTRFLKTFRNNGSGSFALWQTLSISGEGGVELGAIAVADYDNDGDIDVAVEGFTAGGVRRVALFSNDGAGNLSQAQLMTEQIADGALAFGDINQDGRMDFIVTGSSADGSKHTFVHYNDGGAAPYSTPYRLLGPGGGVGEGGALVLGEFTASANLDLFVGGAIDEGGSVSSQIRQYQNNRVAKGLPGNVAPSSPTAFGVAYSSLTQTMTLQWSGAADSGAGATPTNGLYYSVFVNTGPTGQVRVVAPSTSTPLMGIQLRPKINSTTAGLILKGIPTDTTAYFAVASVDAGLKSSGFLGVNIGTWTYIQPNQINDLVAEQNAQAKLTWTAPGDDGTQGNATSYLIRYSITGPISNEAGWSAAAVVGSSMVVGGFPVPAPTQTVQNAIISGLTPSVTTWFSVRAQDELGVPNQGSVSNSPAVRPTMFILAQEPAGVTGPGQYGAVAWGDYDGDGDLDLAMNGFDGVASARRFRVYRNDAGTFVLPSGAAGEPAGPTGPGDGSVAWGDYDRDGDLDLAVNGYDGTDNRFRVYRNDGGTFNLAQEPEGATGPAQGAVAWGDYDNDGDLDLAVNGTDGAGQRFRVYRNDGGTFNRAQEPAGATGPGDGSVAWGDYDNDGDVDLAVNGADAAGNRFRVYRNDAGTFNLAQEPAGVTGPGSLGSVAWGDYDNDGDLDLAVNGADAVTGRFRVYRNDGGTFNLAQEPAGTSPAYYGTVAWGDFDNDGDLDLVVSGQDSSTAYRLRVYMNEGAVASFNLKLDQEPAGVTGPGSGAAWGDFDGDGDLDLAVNGYDGAGWRFRIYKNVRVQQGLPANVAPTNPTVFGTSYSHLADARLTLSWSGATDPEGAGNRLGYYLRLGTATGQGTIISAEKAHDIPSFGVFHRALAGGTTGVFVRGITADTTYYWAVGTLDPGGRSISTALEQMTTSFVAPIAVSNLLSQTTTNEGEIRLTWTAPGDDGTVGTASLYYIRFSNVLVNDANWPVARSATTYASVPAPLITGSTQTTLLADLEPGVTFYFGLKAEDNIGQISTLSNSTYAPSQWLLPLTITTITAVAQATSIIKWDWVDRVGELDYKVMAGAQVAGESLVSPILPKNTTTWTETGLLPNTSYFRHVDLDYEFNGLIHSTNVAIRRYTWASVPGVSVATGAAASSTTFVNLGWSGNGTFYQVQRSTTGVGSWNVALDSIAALTTTDAGLLPDTTYYYQILARNGDYIINPNLSVIMATRTFSAPPTALRVVAKSTGTITWAWTDNATSETGYFVLTTTIGGLGPDILVSSNVGLGAPGDSISKQALVAWTEPGLNPNTQYTRRVRVVNGSTSAALGSVPYDAFFTNSNQIISSMTLPSAPIDLVATGVTQNSASISWNSGLGGAARYKVERATDISGAPGVWGAIIDWTDAHTVKSFTDSGLSANSVFWYRVAAFNTDQDSGTATNPPIRIQLGVQAPTAFAGTAISTGSITWNWADNSSNEENFRVRTSTEGILVTLASNTVSWTEFGLGANTSWPRHVSADTTLGHSDSNSDTGWTWANPPGTPTFSSIMPNGVTVSWGAPTGGAGSYRLERSTVAGLASAVATATGASSGAQTGVSFGDSVAANTTYYYRVLAYNGGGILNPNPGPPAGVLTPPVSVTPGTPVVNSSTSVTWVWTNPATGADAYQVVATTGGSGAVSVSLSSSTTAYTETGLSPNTAYARQITARNAAAYTASTTISTYTWAAAPSAPSFSAVTISTVTVSWTPGAGGAGAYLVMRATTNNQADLAVIVGSQAATSYTNTGLTAGTTHYYAVLAYNMAGVADLTGQPPMTLSPNGAVRTLPVAATSGAPLVNSSSSVTWVWTTPAIGFDSITVQASTGGAVSVSLSSTTTAYTEPGMSPNTAYTRVVRLTNAWGNTDSVVTSTVTLANPPSAPAFSGVGQGSVTILWTPGTGGAGAYGVVRATTSNQADLAFRISSTAFTSFGDGGLTPGTTYYYAVVAYNWAGNGDLAYSPPRTMSSTATVRTLPSAATPGTAKVNSPTSVTWEWTNPTQGLDSTHVLASTGGSVSVSLSSTTTAYTEAGLLPNTAYTRLVRVANGWGITDSVLMSTTTRANPPFTPTFSGVTSNSLTVLWSAGSGGADSYRLLRSTDAGFGTSTTLAGGSAGQFTAIFLGDSALTPNTTYYYAVFAYNAVGALNPVAASSWAKTLPASATPGAPKVNSTTSVTWEWTNPGTGADTVSVRTTTGTAASANLASVTTAFTEAGMSPNTAYTRLVRVTNVSGDVDSVTMSTTTLANIPAAPTPSVITASAITPIWTAPAGEAGSYRVERATETGFITPTTVAGVSSGQQTALSYGDSGLVSNTTYYYRLYAYNTVGAINPTPGAPGTIRTLPAAPTAGTPSVNSPTSVTWSWTNPGTGADSVSIVSVSTALAANTTAYTETGMTPNTSYSRVAQTSNGSGVGNSGAMPAVTLASIPAGLTGLSPSSMTVSISWTAGDASRYQVETATTDTGGVWTTTATILSPGTTHQSVGLNPDTRYWFRLKGVNSALAVNPNPSTARDVVTRQGAPTGFAGVIQSTGAITWSWTDTTANETQFEVRADLTDSLLATLPPNTTTWTETGLSPNTAYSRHVHSVVPSGEGLASGSDTRTTYANVPTLPTFSLIGTSTLTVTWAAGVSGAGSYKVERSTDAGYGSVATATGASAGAQAAVSFADSGLVANTTYYYRVLAYNAAGNLNPTPGASGTTRTLPAAATPAAPKVNSTTSLNWEWTNPGTSADSVSIVTVSTALAANTTAYTESGLAPNSPYIRTVRETNNTGTTDSVTMTTTTLANLPVSLTVLAVSSDVVTLSWTAPTGGAGSYRLERAPDAGGAPGAWATIAGTQSGALTATPYNDAALTPDQKYYYRVLAYNAVGAINPTPTAISTATTRATAVPVLSSSTVTTASILWTWTTGQNVNHVGFLLESATHTVIADLGPSTTSYLEAGLLANTGYTRHVHAKVLTPVGTESPTSNELTIYTRAGSPTALMGAAIGDGKVVLSWTAPANGAYRYRVERAPAVGGSYAAMARVLGPGTTNQDVTAAPGKYAYQVVAENAQGLEAPAISNQVEIEVAGPVTVAVAPTSTATVTVVGSDTGTVKTVIEVPPGAFLVAVSVAISTTPPASAAPAATLADSAARTRGDTKVKVDDDLSDTVRELTAKDDAGRIVQPVKGIKFTIPFNLKKVKSYMAKALKICRLNESSGEWEVAEGDNKADTATGSVTTTITHFSIFRLAYAFSPAPALTADTVKVFPNPLDLTKGAVRGAVKFDGLTAGSVVEVYDIAGDLVVRMEPGFARGGSVNSAPVNGRAEWDGHDLEGNVVVRGLYLYRVLDPGKGSVSGKFAVITK